jgi:phage baseplate assembly protein W
MADFSGMAYPIMKTAKGYFPVITGVDLIKGDLLQLLLTNPGERCMMPNFGTPLRDLMFDPNDTLLGDRARQMIINSIKTFEPRIVIDAIEVMTNVDKEFLHKDDDLTNREHVLGIRIIFRDPQDIQEVQELVLQVPLQGAANNANRT